MIGELGGGEHQSGEAPPHTAHAEIGSDNVAAAEGDASLPTNGESINPVDALAAALVPPGTSRRDFSDPAGWRTEAACRGPTQALFFPPSELERRGDKRQREKRAKEVCRSCPVEMECRDYSIEIREQHGIWGGLTEGERRVLGGW